MGGIYETNVETVVMLDTHRDVVFSSHIAALMLNVCCVAPHLSQRTMCSGWFCRQCLLCACLATEWLQGYPLPNDKAGTVTPTLHWDKCSAMPFQWILYDLTRVTHYRCLQSRLHSRHCVCSEEPRYAQHSIVRRLHAAPNAISKQLYAQHLVGSGCIAACRVDQTSRPRESQRDALEARGPECFVQSC